MKDISYKRHRFPPEVIEHAVWLYFRFTMSLRDVEDLLAERGIDVSYETVRCWNRKFGLAISRNLRRLQGKADTVWHADEMGIKIGSKRLGFGMIPRIIRRLRYMWRALDKEGVVLDAIVQKRRNKAAALKLLKKLLKRQGFVPDKFVTDGLTSYKAAMKELGCQARHALGRLRENNRAESSHLPVRRRERKMQRFKSQGHARLFISTYSAVYNNFNIDRHLTSRNTMRYLRNAAMEEWKIASGPAG